MYSSGTWLVVFKEMWGMCPAHLTELGWKVPEPEIELS